MQAKSHYDLVVVGDQLGGYLLAAASAQQGAKVLLVEGHGQVSAVHRLGTGDFLNDVNCELAFGLFPESSLDEFLKNLGLYSSIGEAFVPVDAPTQLLSEKFRVNEIFQMEEAIRGWTREFPHLTTELRRFYEIIYGPSKLAGNSSAGAIVNKCNLPSWWENISKAQVLAFSSLLPARLGSSALRLSLSRAANSIRYIRGGKDSLKAHLSSRILLSGGAIKRGAWAEEIVFEYGKLGGVLLSSFEGYVRAPHVVGAMGAKRFYNLVPKSLRNADLSRQIQSLNPKYWRFSFCLNLPEEAFPEGMSSHAVIFDPENQDFENLMQVFAFSKGAYSGMQAGRRYLVVKVLLPYSPISIDKQYLTGVIKRSCKKLQKFMPFLDMDQVVISPDPKNLSEDPLFKAYYNFSEISRIPVSYLVYDRIYDPHCEVGISTNWDQFGLTGLGLASRDVNPLYGVYGEILAAKMHFDHLKLAKAVSKSVTKSVEART